MKIESKREPGSFVSKRQNSNAFWLDEIFHEFNVISPGLTGEQGTVSFQSTQNPKKYLRQYNFNIILESEDSDRRPESFDADATFRLHTNRFVDIAEPCH